jgi:hypothetical protein
MRNLRLLVDALRQDGRPRPPSTREMHGRVAARVFPRTFYDRVLFAGVTADVLFAPGAQPSQARLLGEKAPGRVALVLGGGNVSSIPPMDALYKLFVENQVVVLKMNPVNAWLAPHLEQIFAPLVADGFLAIVQGDAHVGAELARHPLVETLHVTGSDRTYDAIVWGGDPVERARRKAEHDPVNTRAFTAELGCVTPICVVPGPWSAADLDFQARHVAAMVANNASFNCNAAKVLVTARGWLQRGAFLRKVEEALARTPPRRAYYPGAEQRYREMVHRYTNARVVGAEAEGAIPWTILPDVPPAAGEYALAHEAFCGVLAEVTLDAEEPAEFLAAAVDFANDRCWGTLSCGLLAHPFTLRDQRAAIDDAVLRLRYGTVSVNCWPAVAYALVSTPWGAYPGHTPEDIRSGSGVVHNAFLFDNAEKAVVRAPFRIRPTPPYFADNRNGAAIGRALVRYEAAPSFGAVARVVAAAARG